MAVVAAVLACAAASALGAATYVFEPVRSLTGNCAESVLDPVPDPGTCPMPPGVAGVDHPTVQFEHPGVVTDAYGDVYVSNDPLVGEGRIDVFSPDGVFITDFPDPAGPQSLAVDDEGNVYVFDRVPGKDRLLRRFSPSVYEPLKEEIEYGLPPVVLANQTTKNIVNLSPFVNLAIGPSNRLYLNESVNITIFGSAKEGNEIFEKNILPVPEGSGGALTQSKSTAIDLAHGKIYVSDKVAGGSNVRIFELASPHKEIGEFNGKNTPKGEFLSGEGNLVVAADDKTGHVFIGDTQGSPRVFEFEEGGAFLATIEHGIVGVAEAQIAVSDGPFAPHPGYFYVPSNPTGLGHVYAFKPDETAAPVTSGAFVSGVTETEAVLHASVNPKGLSTAYRLEYVSEEEFEASGFANAIVASEGVLPPGGSKVAISGPALNLAPATGYRFRAFAENSKGEAEEVSSFFTFPQVGPPPPCANDDLRKPFSIKLPDCRAYELVTPPDTNGRPPSGVAFSGVYFPTLEAAPDGNRASFLIEGGTIPGFEGAGAFNGDLYLSTRSSEGWTTEVTGPSGKEAVGPNPGSVSPDQTYSFWEDADNLTPYVRYPDGHSAIVGRGSLADDPHVEANLLTEGGGHIIFSNAKGTAVPLEEDAPAAGIATVYDRTSDEVTHVVSLLPGNVTPTGEENARYLGASEEGEGIAFSIQGTIYLRLHNEETFKVAEPGSTFAGVVDEGKRLFYLEGGDLFAFDAEAEETIDFSSSGDVTPVNVPPDGTRAYFVSPSVLTGEPNPNGEAAKKGAENLYLSEEGAISFVGIVTKRDVEGESRPDGEVGGLGLWTYSLKEGKPADDPSRTTPSGVTFLFESRADLTGFDSNGFVEIYRYDSAQGLLDCLSCSPTGTPPTSDASLQSIAESQPSLLPFSARAKISNQSPDGRRAFFQTAEQLVMGDTDGKLDVYEWEEEGIGSCETPGGCTYLISSGESASPDFLYAMSTTGDDVFFRTADLLLPRDVEATVSIYDARVGGGFAEPSEEVPCSEGETCRPAPTPTPSLPSFAPIPTPPAPTQHGCPKGKHKAKSHGKTVCAKNQKKKKHHHKTGSKKRGAAR